MITKTDTMILGYRLHIDEGVTLKPRWWEILIRVGIRPARIHYATPSNAVLLCEQHGFMTVRREDAQELLNDPPNFLEMQPPL